MVINLGSGWLARESVFQNIICVHDVGVDKKVSVGGVTNGRRKQEIQRGVAAMWVNTKFLFLILHTCSYLWSEDVEYFYHSLHNFHIVDSKIFKKMISQ